MNTIVTRFAPSPTGNLHIGGVRTALINYIISKQAKKKFPNSKFLFRIEDTDRKRSEEIFKDNILKGIKWLGLNFDEEIYIQSQRIERHVEIANKLLANKKAFKCICTQELLEKKRKEFKINRKNMQRLCSTCKDSKTIQASKKNYTLRIIIPEDNFTEINDLIQGSIKINNQQIDNYVLLREDGTPTYMLSVVVDDYDMGVNLVLRGDDHLNNAFRQSFIYKGMSWKIPNYAHMALIHGEDGKKLSKRHGAVDINEFKEKGYLQESIINNLILLGWAPTQTNEIIGLDEIIDQFDINKISKSSSIFSYDKLNYFNNYYLKKDEMFIKLIDFCTNNLILKDYLDSDKEKMKRIFSVHKNKINFYSALLEICPIYFNENYKITDSNFDSDFKELVKDFNNIIEKLNNWEVESLEIIIKEFINNKKIKFIKFGKPARILLINKENGPSISDILYILGKKNSLKRIKNYIEDK